MPQEEVDALMEQEVASCADMTIQNSDFMFYYNEQLYQFTNVYSAYLSFMMNQQQALDEQMNMDGVYTWEQTFVDASLRNFQRLAALKAHAEAEGYVLPESEQARVETLKADLEAMGQSYGFADATEYLQATFGPAATFEAYLDFYTANVYVSSYLAKVQSETSCTDAELEAYYEENAQMLTESYGIEKIDRNVVAARHILIQPESTVAEDGTESISDEAWAAAEAEAQRIYEEWLAGEATEETFAELAGTYTQDPGSQATGGLYEDIYPGQMVPEFNDWCFADGRTVGDHGVVKTSYGYHIMFFAGEGDYIYWKMAVADMVVSDKVNDFIANLCAGCELTSDASKVVLLNAIAPTAPAAEAETETQTEAQ